MFLKNYCKFLYLSFIFICLISPSSATFVYKRKRYDAESSQANKRQNTDVASSSAQNLDDFLKKIDTFKPDCAPEALIGSKDVTGFLKNCDLQVQEWTNKKLKKLNTFGLIIQRWFARLFEVIDYDNNYLNLILQPDNLQTSDVRDDIEISRKLQNSWRPRRGDEKIEFIENLYENLRLAYYFGDGICVHLLEPPFNRVEKLMETVISDFQYFDHIENNESLISILPASQQIYLSQKLCRKFYKMPRNPKRPIVVFTILNDMKNESDIVDNESARSYISSYFELIMRNKLMKTDKCGWLSVYLRKKQYAAFSHMILDPDFERLKISVDESMDAFVHSCLSTMQTSGEDIFEKVSVQIKKNLLPELLEWLSAFISSYRLPLDESINTLLDIRSSSNELKTMLIEGIKQSINQNEDLSLANLLIDLLLGKLGDLDDGIFRKPTSKVKQFAEYKTLEFLSRVFSINGYKPHTSHELINFYYLYKISEICNIIQFDSLNRNASYLADTQSKNNSATSLQAPDNIQNDNDDTARTQFAALFQILHNYINNINDIDSEIDYIETAVKLIDDIDSFQSTCTQEKLLEFESKDVSEEEVTYFLIKCDLQAQYWLTQKLSKLENFGLIIKRWYVSTINSYIKGKVSLGLIRSKDMRKNVLLSKKLQQGWFARETDWKDGYIMDDDAHENARRAYYFGDGVCDHILAPPFDRAESLMSTVMKEFRNLKYIRDIKKKSPKEAPAYFKINIVQRLCRKFYNQPINPRGQVLHPYVGLVSNDSRLAQENFNTIKTNDEKCDWYEVYTRKLQYRLVLAMQKDIDFEQKKALVDNSLDALVGNCLTMMQTTSTEDDENQIYAKVKGSSIVYLENFLPDVVELLASSVESYQLPIEQSINYALDIRSSENEFKEHLFENIRKLIREDGDIRLADVFINLLSGNFGNLENGIFREPIYKNKKNVEFKLHEFLFHIFSIKGYKTQVSHQLLDFYYFYKISEICNMISVAKLFVIT